MRSPYPNPSKLDMGLLDPLLLGSEVALEVAKGVLEGYLGNPTVSSETFAKVLSHDPALFAFAISVINDSAFKKISSWAENDFPTEAKAFLASTFQQLLDRLSLFLFSLHSQNLSKDDMYNIRHSVQLTPPVLEALSYASLPSESLRSPISPISPTEDQDGDGIFEFATRQTQKQRKQMRKGRSYTRSLDPKPFNHLGVRVPTTQEQARALVQDILAEQKYNLQHFLCILRDPEMKDSIYNAYIHPQTNSNDNHKASGENPNPPDDATTAEVTTETPEAFPMIQPMRAALYFDSADGLGQWRILVSTRADADLRQARKRNSELFRIIIKKIRELSNGHFSDDNQKALTGTETEIPIYEAKMTRDSRLIYQIDCVPEFESDVERQVIRIFGIYTHAQLDRRFWDGVGHHLGRKGKEYKKRCTFRSRPSKSGEYANVILPASFPSPEEVPAPAEPPVSQLPDLHRDDLEKLHEVLVLEKYVTFSQALLNSILADQDIVHVFDVSPQEKQIIEHPLSCYVLGRSGTGKTTTMLFKMLGIERSWQMYQDTMPKPRQMFVTQSRVLAEKVQEFFVKLYESLSAANKSPEEIKKIAAAKETQQEQGLVDLDEEIDWRGDLPKRYGDLQDEHFPMFVTFDQLCRLLEAEFNNSMSVSKESDGAADLRLLSSDYMQQRRASFVSFGVFLESYWSHFPQPLTKGLDPALVFGEFMGVIKGSELSLNSATGYLDKDAYLGLSHRTQGTFINQRELIYSLFMVYLKRKRERGDYDAADRTHTVLNGLRQKGTPGRLLDFLYIDEAQDNLLIDALVLRTICTNPASGLFWAGDTAQTISVGSAFRFNDLKAFLYRVEESAASASVSRIQPASFELGVNYRSHAGIVNCAHSVVKLITQFWPHAIDHLAEERGIIEGIKPVYFTGWDESSVRYEQFLFGSSGEQIEFGAHQCILVRDDAARDRLRAQVGDIGLIMTLYESKGLEFNDVLLYNFFADSTVDATRWRVVLNALPEHYARLHKAPHFDDSRHHGVCRELKFLYVAITRARKNLWIADSSDKGDPMRIFWTSKEQIEICMPDSNVPRLATSSTPEEWAKTALALFNNKRYMQAEHCYERASMPREKAVAHAYYLREKARNTPLQPRDNNEERTTVFIDAADAFWNSAESKDAGAREKRAYYRIAAECYSMGGDDGKAGDAYRRASEFTLSAKSYRKAGEFEQAVDVVTTHRSDVDENVAESIIDVSRLEFLRIHKLKQARQLFESDEEALEYMDDFGLDIARVTLLEELGRFAEAAQLRLQEGRILEAIRLFMKDSTSADSVHRASLCLLDGLWRGLPLGVSPNSELATSNVRLQELIPLANQVHISDEDARIRDEILMFRAIISNESPALLSLADQFLNEHHNEAAALRCLDHVFASTPKLQVAAPLDVASDLQKFYLYTRLMQKLAYSPRPCRNEDIQRLFTFEPATEDSFLIPEHTFLHRRCNDRLTPMLRSTDQGIIVLEGELDKLVKDVLKERLYTRVTIENDICSKARALQLCLSFFASGRCALQDCWRMHVDAGSYSIDDYNLRIRIVLQQILIYHSVYAVEHPQEQAGQRRQLLHRRWLRILHEALHPLHYKMGSPHHLKPELIPECERALHIATAWAEEWLQSLEPYGNAGLIPTFLTSLMRATALVFSAGKQTASHQLTRARCISACRPPPLLREDRGVKVYVVHDLLYLMSDDSPYSLFKGILFMNHVIENRTPIDVGLLCNLLDCICAMMIVDYRYKMRHSLHDITLPHSWLIRLLQEMKKLGSRETRFLPLYLKPMVALLEQVQTGHQADYLLFESRDLASIGWQTRAVFVARICRNLCLLGYNSPSYAVRADIHRIVTSLASPGRKVDQSYEQYASARSWAGLAKAVQYSTTGSSLDELIQLHEADKTAPHLHALPNVKRIIYKTIDEVPILLTTGATTIPKSTLNATAAEFVPAHVSAADPSADISDDEADTEDMTGEDPQMLSIDDVAELAASGPDDAAPEPPTDAELAVAHKLLRGYRRRKKLRQLQEKFDGVLLHTSRHRIVTSFHQKSRSMEWPHRYYKMLYLGPIPLLLLCLERTKDYLYDQKDKAKKRIRTAKHQDLEEAKENLTKLTGSMKEAINLYKLLQPTSEFHLKRDLEVLKLRTQDVQRLVQQLPAGATYEWQDDLEIALKAIVESRAAVSMKKEKPELNLEDIDGFEAY
ncbi:hypothetical protein WOLCODRAFT_62498 [Wolfiporia cocos MD-104 SS10]|uniref:UvrD-like helicase ATP-binding domain-containing protein n=1 Tax=Wolfiporia cocos (strain MD-104) TaxID=742152 RepID=A0A2H3IST4_WOLCO|nr:hypothetical protein WOLCODRAFT_62498 [Wolfiporia cocos MD-104 SS10]